MKTLLTLLIIVALAYLALSFVEWTINPAHWSAIARAALLIVVILVSLKPIADIINARRSAENSDPIGSAGQPPVPSDQPDTERVYRGTTSIRG